MEEKRRKAPSKAGEKASVRADSSKAKLRERVKELTCLYGIAQIALKPDMTLEGKLAAIVRLLPPAWQYPSKTCAKIDLDGQIFESSGFRKGVHYQSSAITITGRKRGKVEIHYRDDGEKVAGKPFLKEEKKLIDNISRQLALIIEHKEAEAAKYELQKQLIRSDRLAAIGQLAAGVAHQLNEPLNTILGYTQLVLKNENLPAQCRMDLEKTAEAALHARSIIRELLIFAREGKPGNTRVNLNSIITGELGLFEALCEKSGIELMRVIDPGLPEIVADKSQIMQVFSNLIINALHAMPGGGKLALKTSFDSSSVFFTVEDNGTGMSEEVRESIFLPFFTTKDIDQGTGLGLSVVHGIVTFHGGKISVETEPGRGTCFTVAFPVARDTEGKY